jgi:N-methylhydantoinase A
VGRFDLAQDTRQGPLLIDEYDATTLVPPGCSVRLDEFGNILILTEA